MQLGRYQIIDKLGAGGMGIVYRAVALGVDGFKKPVVIKRIRSLGRRNRPDVVQRFVNEARILMTMSYGHVVQVLDLCKVNNEYFMVLEYVEGADLSTLLSQCKKVNLWPSQSEALLIVSHVLRALDYAHRRKDESGRSLGIIHRDVKPANVLCSVEGEIKLTDFGVASLPGSGLTRAGDVIGTISYMSPEQSLAEPIDQRSDLFSVGTILYLLLCRKHPFSGSDLQTVQEQVWNARIEPPSSLGIKLSPQVEDLLLTAMARERTARFDDASSMLAEVETCQRLAGSISTSSDLQALFREVLGDSPELWRCPAHKEQRDSFVGTELGGFLTASVTAAHSPASTDERSMVALSGGDPLAQTKTRVDEICAPESDTFETKTATPGALSAGISKKNNKRGALLRWGLMALLAAGAAMAGVLLATRIQMSDTTLRSRATQDASSPLEAPLPHGPKERVVRRDATPQDTTTLDTTPTTSPTLQKKRAQKRRTRPTHHQVKPAPRGWVIVSTRPAFAEVHIGGRLLDTTPCRLRLRAGKHTLKLINPRLKLSVTRTVTVHADREVRVLIKGYGLRSP